MTATRKHRDSLGRVVISAQELTHELEQFGALANELCNRLDGFIGETSIRATVLSSLISAQRSSKACSNHLRAATLLSDSDV